MNRVDFTAFLRILLAREPSADEARAVWLGLARLLRAEIERRGLWDAPPAYLGILGARRWESESGAPRSASDGGLSPALAELAADCYSYIFVDRVRSLGAQLRVKPTIEGLVRRNIANFLFERQKEHDPLGFRIYELARRAVEASLEDGELRALDGVGDLENASRFALVAAQGAALPPTDGASAIEGWAIRLLPALLAGPGNHQAGAAVAALRAGFAALALAGVRELRFRDLVDPLKRGARRELAARLESDSLSGNGGAPHREPAVEDPALLALEAADRYRWLRHATAASIATSPHDARTRAELAALWDHLCTRSLEGHAAAEAGSTADQSKEDAISYRRLASTVGIPRERLPDLLGLLAELVDRQRAAPTRGGSP